MLPLGCPAGTTFSGDYFGVISAGRRLLTTSISTYDDGMNAAHCKQRVIATITIA